MIQLIKVLMRRKIYFIVRGMDELKKTWSDLNTGTGPLRATMILGMTFGVSIILMLLAGIALVYMAEQTVSVIFLAVLATLPLWASWWFDRAANSILPSAKCYITPIEFFTISQEESKPFKTRALAVPLTPPRAYLV